MMLTVKMEAGAGSLVDHVAGRMQKVANQLGVDVEVDFNGVSLFAIPGGEASWLVNGFHAELQRELFPLRPKMAFSNREPEQTPTKSATSGENNSTNLPPPDA